MNGIRMICSGLVAAMLMALPTPLRAQRCRACVAEDTVPRVHVLPAIGVRVGAPQKASFAIGLLVGEDWQSNSRDHSRNIALFAEPGVSGGRASVAYIHHGFGHFGSGYGVAGTVLRTWNDPWWTTPNVSYIGGELIVWPIVFIGPRLGLFRSVRNADSHEAGRWLFTFDFGFGV